MDRWTVRIIVLAIGLVAEFAGFLSGNPLLAMVGGIVIMYSMLIL